jgi:hypothetical protein
LEKSFRDGSRDLFHNQAVFALFFALTRLIFANIIGNKVQKSGLRRFLNVKKIPADSGIDCRFA